MLLRKTSRSISGASMVEFALGSGVFFAIIFGMISFSLAISSKILLIRAADYVSLDAITNTDLRLDTRQSSAGSSTLNSYIAARETIKNRGMNFINASWLSQYIIKYYWADKFTSSDASEIIVLRPGESYAALNPIPKDENNEIHYSVLYASFPDCINIGSSYADTLRKCPIHIEIRARISLWPLGSYVISGVSARYIENYEQKQTFPSGPAVNGQTGANLTMPPNTVPAGNPTPTHTPNPTITPTPTLQSTPNNCFCYGCAPDAAGLACFPDPPQPQFPSECVLPCLDNQGTIIGYNCKSICGAQ